MRSDSTYGVFNGESPIQPDSGGSFAPLEMLRIFKPGFRAGGERKHLRARGCAREDAGI
jgi:hypothetical protein